MAIEITDKIREVLEAHCFGFLTLTDGDGQPILARHFGYTWDEPLTRLIIYTFIKDVQPMALYFSQETKLAMVAANGATFKTLQFKGTYHKHYMAREEEMDTVRKFNSAQADLMLTFFGLSEETFANWNYAPALAVVMDINEIYEQTPKKNTGNKIN